jgi:hypothetical protein
MEITSSVARRISQFAWMMAAAGTVIGQVHALARAQAHPDDFEESPLARAWGVPATRALRPLLDWSDPYTVYVTYGKIWLPVCIAFTAAAYLVYRRRHPKGAERRLWQGTLAGYAVMTLSVFGDYFTPWMDQMFLLGIGAMLVIGFGGIALGIVMLRKGFPTAHHPDSAHDLHPVHVRGDRGDVARQCVASAHVGLGRRGPRRRIP